MKTRLLSAAATAFLLSGAHAESLLTPEDPIIAFDLDRPGTSRSDYPSNDSPASGIDGRTDTKYANTGKANSGFIVTPASAVAVQSFVITTASDAAAGDPASWEIYGTNDPIVSADNSEGDGENWELIAEGTLALPAARRTAGEVTGFANTTAWTSYRLVFPTLKTPATATAMQFSEIQFFPNEDGTGAPVLAPGNPARAIQIPVIDSRYPGNEAPPSAIDGSITTKYLNFGILNTGFIVTPVAGPKTARSFIITTANDGVERDPASWQIYGTNDAITSADNTGGDEENWTLVAEGALALPADRQAEAPAVSFTNGTAWTSWRMVFPAVKTPGTANSMQLAEVQFYTEPEAGGDPILAPEDPIIAIHLPRSRSGYRMNNEKPSNVIDGLATTKYLNFAKRNTGFIVTPAAAAAVQSLVLTTANDFPDRDPASYALYGTNDTIASQDNSNGGAESWTLVSGGLLNLPAARQTAAPAVSFTNATVYSSWRLIFTSVKNPVAAASMQVAEVQFFPQAGGAGPPVLAPGNPILAVQTGISASSSPGAESPLNAIDDNPATKYLNFGKTNTGFIVTPSSGPRAVQSILLTTANDAVDRDPATWVLYGTNDPVLSAPDSEGNNENWTFVAKGRADLPEDRRLAGPLLSFSNTTAWTSWRLIFPSVKNPAGANSMQIAEVQFYPDAAGLGTPVLAAGDPVTGIQLLSSNSDSPDAEEVRFAIDGDPATKYLNFGRDRAGFIVTPQAGPSIVTGFTMTTANDSPSRDPANWELYGTNEALLSANHSEGDLETWTLIASGLLELPEERGVAGDPPVTFANTTSWTSYRFLVRSVKDPAAGDAVAFQFAEIQFEGSAASAPPSGFVITNITAQGNPVQSIQLSWLAEADQSYTIQAGTALAPAGQWTPVGNFTGTGSLTTATINIAANPALTRKPRVFFRILKN